MIKLFFVLSVVISFLCGCSGPRAVIDGVEYEILSEAEVKRLCELSAMYLRSNVPDVISLDDAVKMKKMTPECNIKYRGDRIGRAVVKWSFPKYTVSVVFDGRLLETSAGCWVQKELKQPDVIDFSRRKEKLKVLQDMIGQPSAPLKNKNMQRSKTRVK